MPLDDETRAMLVENIRDLRRTITEIELLKEPHLIALRPHERAIEHLQGVQERLLERAGVELLDHGCEFCNAILFVGDQGHRGEDCIVVCAECAPTYADGKRQADAREAKGGLDGEDNANIEHFRAAYQAHIDAGGSPDDKMTYPL